MLISACFFIVQITELNIEGAYKKKTFLPRALVEVFPYETSHVKWILLN